MLKLQKKITPIIRYQSLKYLNFWKANINTTHTSYILWYKRNCKRRIISYISTYSSVIMFWLSVPQYLGVADILYVNCTFLGALARMREATINFVTSVSLSVRLSEWNNSAPTWRFFHEIWYLRTSSQICWEKFSLIKIWEEGRVHWIILRLRSFSDKRGGDNENVRVIFNNFSHKKSCHIRDYM